jgi:hypothetical protein
LRGAQALANLSRRVIRAAPLLLVGIASCKFVTPLDEHEYSSGSGSVAVSLDDSRCVLADAGCQLSGDIVVDVGTYPGSCPGANASSEDREPVAQLLASSPDADERVAGTVDPIPPLPEPGPGHRAYFALLRDDRCGVVGWGCTDLDFTNQTQVTIAVQPAGSPPLGACFGASCACTGTGFDGGSDAPVDGAAPDGGCSLTLVSAGSLPPPLQPGDVLAGPSLVPTGQGFVVALREQWSAEAGTGSALRTLRLEPDGTIASPPLAPLDYYDQSCTAAIPDDGIGAAFDSTKGGLLAVSLPACGAHGAGATFVPFSADGTPSPPGFNSVGSFADLRLVSAHSLAPSFATGDFELMYLSGGAAYDALIPNSSVQSATSVAPGTPAAFAALASSSSLRTELLGLTADGGYATRIYAGAPGTSPQLSATLPGVHAASVASSGNGAVVAGIVAGGLVWQTLNGGGQALAASASPGVGGTFASLDVAATGDPTAPYVVVGGTAGDATMVLVDAMARTVGSPVRLSVNPILGELLASFGGGNLAVGSGQGVIAVVWLTAHRLGAGDPTGGYAVFACP